MVTVLNEVLEELQQTNKSIKQLSGTVADLGVHVKAFEKKELKTEPPDLQPVVTQCEVLRKEAAEGLARVAAAVAVQPKPIIRRISLFPENDRDRHFKFFLKWVLWFVVMLLTFEVGYLLISEYIERTHPYILQQPSEKVRADSVKTKRIR